MPRNVGFIIRWALAILFILYFSIVSQIQTIISAEESTVRGILVNELTNENPPVFSPERSSNGLNKRINLQEKLDSIYIKTGRPYQGNLWDLSDFAPAWMKEYFDWHKKERQRLLSDPSFDWRSTRLLIMQCVRQFDNKCGGTADRTKPFLFLLREAYKSERFLVIHWNLPAPLEEFLVPPQGGFDWRAPDGLKEMLTSKPKKGPQFSNGAFLRTKRNHSEATFRSRLQSATGFKDFYDEDREEPGEATLEEVFHDAWRIFFTPSPPVQSIIEKELKQMNLTPGKYSAAHLRALYGKVQQDRSERQLFHFTSQTVNCASKLLPGKPIFFASDFSNAIDMAIDYGKTKTSHVVSRKHMSLPLHLDKAEGDHNPADFYDTFVDLYLMGMSRCVSHSIGGFGQWASLISFNSTCRHNIKITPTGVRDPCNWTDPTVSEEEKESDSTIRTPLFLEPMT